MQNRRRQADLPVEEPTYLGPMMDAMMGVDDNAPKELGNWKGMPPTLNPFWQAENINKVADREGFESQGEREARLAKRLLVLLRRQG